jgi:cytochrome P450
MLIKGYINQLCGETPTNLRMGVPAPITNFDDMSAAPTETHCKAAINAPYQSRQDARKLEEWLKMQPQRLLMMGMNPDTYNVVVWVTSQFSGALNSWWLNRKTQATISDTFDSLITKIRKTSMLPNIIHDAITDMLPIEIEIEIEIVYNMYRMRRFTTNTVCAGCCLWALPTMPYRKLTSQG